MKTCLVLLLIAAGLAVAMANDIIPMSVLATWWPVGLCIGGIVLGMVPEKPPGAAKKNKMP